MTKIVLSDNQELAVCAALLPRSGATLATCRRLFHTPDKAHTTSIVERIKALSLATEEERKGKVLLIPTTPQNATKRAYFRKFKEDMIKDLTPRQITQLTTLSAHGDYETGDLFCSVEKVSQWLHLSSRQAIRLLKSMQQSGLITRISRGHYVLNYVEISSTAVAKRCAVAVQEVTPPPAELQEEETPTPPAYQQETPPPARLQEETPETTSATPTAPPPAAVQPADHDETTPATAATPPPPAARPQDVRSIAGRIAAQRGVFKEKVNVCRELDFGGWYLDEGQPAKERGTIEVELTAEQLVMIRPSERATYEDYKLLLVELNDFYRNDFAKWEQDARTLAERLTISHLQVAAYLATSPAPVKSLNLNTEILMQTAAGVERWVRAQRGATKGSIMKQIERRNAADCRKA